MLIPPICLILEANSASWFHFFSKYLSGLTLVSYSAFKNPSIPYSAIPLFYFYAPQAIWGWTPNVICNMLMKILLRFLRIPLLLNNKWMACNKGICNNIHDIWLLQNTCMSCSASTSGWLIVWWASRRFTSSDI